MVDDRLLVNLALTVLAVGVIILGSVGVILHNHG